MIGGRSSPEAVEFTLEAMPEYSHLTRKERMKVAMLKKRVNFLKRRAEQSPNNLTWDAQEIAALTFALGYIASHDPNTVITETSKQQSPKVPIAPRFTKEKRPVP